MLLYRDKTNLGAMNDLPNVVKPTNIKASISASAVDAQDTDVAALGTEPVELSSALLLRNCLSEGSGAQRAERCGLRLACCRREPNPRTRVRRTAGHVPQGALCPVANGIFNPPLPGLLLTNLAIVSFGFLSFELFLYRFPWLCISGKSPWVSVKLNGLG